MPPSDKKFERKNPNVRKVAAQPDRDSGAPSTQQEKKTDLLNGEDYLDTENLPDFAKKRSESESEQPQKPLKPGEVVLLTPEEL